ncbi:Aste57867_21045 [Aphanomyces stellatus]|uniref:Aste57867_21045 protein n=1 Tax=Aphanomyces stellatus TaxID=120398 RepID=A0A485LHX6_9STRA|nr:hypothetical protein As57867_020977 [Aphanomyces stellatus]VFT97720.1 Aste57867_21045 [Aphanomyces stellatus]
MFRHATSTALRQLNAKAPKPAMSAVAFSFPAAASSSTPAASITARRFSAAAAVRAPAHVKGDVTTIAISVAAILAAAGVGKIWWDASSEAVVTKEKLASYFNELAAIVENLVSQFPAMMDTVMQQAKSQGQQISEAQIKNVLVERLGQAIQMADQDLSKKYQFTQEALEVAMLEMQQEPEVQAAIQRLQLVIDNSPLGETVEVPEDLTADLTFTIMSEVLDGVSRAMEEALDEAKKAGMKNVSLEGHLWQEAYMQKTYMYTAEIHLKYNVTEPILNAAVSKYSQENPEFQHKLQALLAKHQENFQRMGLPLDG